MKLTFKVRSLFTGTQEYPPMFYVELYRRNSHINRPPFGFPKAGELFELLEFERKGLFSPCLEL